MEFISHDLVKKRRGKGRKVSVHHIKITAKTILKEECPENPKRLKQVMGGFIDSCERNRFNFLKRNMIKINQESTILIK